MNIHLVSFFFYPEISPRAFRAFELVKQFDKDGHKVDVFIPNNDCDYTNVFIHGNVTIHKVSHGFFLNKESRQLKQRTISEFEDSKELYKPNVKSRIKHKLIELFYPGGFNFEFGFTAGKALRKLRNKPDITISIGLPICSHVAVRVAYLFRFKSNNLLIADYGDPYSFNKTINPPLFHKWAESLLLKKFDYILVPTEKMVSAFEYFKKPAQIKVIPQGVDLSGVKRSAEKWSDSDVGVKYIAYAGVFYEEIRNPSELFEYLLESNLNYKIVLYTNLQDPINNNIINSFLSRFQDRIIVHGLLPRKDVIFELSKADILLNVWNTTGNQTPSKLIDYSVTNVPIYSYTPGQFDKETLEMFFKGDFSKDSRNDVDTKSFDIKNVVSNILKLKQ